MKPNVEKAVHQGPAPKATRVMAAETALALALGAIAGINFLDFLFNHSRKLPKIDMDKRD